MSLFDLFSFSAQRAVPRRAKSGCVKTAPSRIIYGTSEQYGADQISTVVRAGALLLIITSIGIPNKNEGTTKRRSHCLLIELIGSEGAFQLSSNVARVDCCL